MPRLLAALHAMTGVGGCERALGDHLAPGPVHLPLPGARPDRCGHERLVEHLDLDLIVVDPNACSIVTGKAASPWVSLPLAADDAEADADRDDVSASSPQAAPTNAATSATTTTPVRLMAMRSTD